MKQLIIISTLLIFSSCTNSQSQDKPEFTPGDFNNYWYGGEAELTSYELEQARYGEIHAGEAVLVFVTEPFSKSKQVKLDDWRNTSEDNVSVMKLNFNKKFLTGIYPYSMMTSTFVPVSADKFPKPIKVTTTSQEWCGHTFTQINYAEETYRLRGFSYFESEGDFDTNIDPVILEDELWTRIRLNPSALPTGSIQLLPGTFYLRLRHQEAKPQQAKATLTLIDQSEFSNKKQAKYQLEYSNRTLAIYFNEKFPHEIVGWEETYTSGFENAELLTTKAKKINTIKSAYWQKNSNEDRVLRKSLGLSEE